MPDQRGLVRGYVKYENEIRTGRNIKQIVHRALQFAHSDPEGPGLSRRRARGDGGGGAAGRDRYRGLAADLAGCARRIDDVAALAEDLSKARRPLVVTSYLGRNPDAVAELVTLSRRLGVGGAGVGAELYELSGRRSDVPGQPVERSAAEPGARRGRSRPGARQRRAVDSDGQQAVATTARIYHIDVDPLKQQMPLWYIAAKRVFRADAATALRQINEHLDGVPVDKASVEARRAHYADLHAARDASLRALEQPQGDIITGEILTACIRAPCRRRHDRPQRGHLALQDDHRPSRHDAAGQHGDERRRLARLERRRGDRRRSWRSRTS